MREVWVRHSRRRETHCRETGPQFLEVRKLAGSLGARLGDLHHGDAQAEARRGALAACPCWSVPSDFTPVVALTPPPENSFSSRPSRRPAGALLRRLGKRFFRKKRPFGNRPPIKQWSRFARKPHTSTEGPFCGSRSFPRQTAPLPDCGAIGPFVDSSEEPSAPKALESHWVGLPDRVVEALGQVS